MKVFKVILIVFFVSFGFAFANEVEDFILNIGKQTDIILNGSKEKEQNYLDFIEKNVDVDWISKFVLGQEAKKLKSEQFEEFKDIYKKYLIKNYVSKIKDYNKDLKIVKSIDKGKDVFVVTITTKDKVGTKINVDFRVVKESKFLITDIIPEGISFIGSQRTDITTSIKKEGFEKTLKKLKAK